MKLHAILWDTDMRSRHEGLLEYAKSQKALAGRDLRHDDVLCFVNAKRDRVILLTGIDEKNRYGVLAYYRSSTGRIEERAIQYIPECFSGRKIEYTKALEKALIEHLPEKVVKLRG